MSMIRPAKGFSLLEVLIAVIILAIGLLSMAALYVRSLQSVTESYMLTNANAFVNQVATKMKFMTDVQRNSLMTDFDLTTQQSVLLNKLASGGYNFDSSALDKLPDVRMAVSQYSAPSNLYQITLAWKATQVKQGANVQSTRKNSAGSCVPNDTNQEFTCFKTYVHIK